MSDNETTETASEADVPAAGAETATATATATPAKSGGPVSGKAAAPAAPGAGRANRRKVREGLVVSTKMDKTAVVAVTERVRHPRYAKTVQRTHKLYVHDEKNEANDGDRVRVAETRPMSKTKRWRLVEVLERAR